jgi:crossover junction endodeoxyribonuclease RuvC
MFDRSVLGVDPGTASVGLALVGGDPSGPAILWTVTVRTPADQPPAERLGRVFREVATVLRDRRPAAVAIERLMWGRNAGSAMEVARASGAVMVAAAQAGVSVEEYAPLEVKMAVAGAGNAPKAQVRLALARLFGMQGVPTEPDAADAVAVAVCHLQQSRLRALQRTASR